MMGIFGHLWNCGDQNVSQNLNDQRGYDIYCYNNVTILTLTTSDFTKITLSRKIRVPILVIKPKQKGYFQWLIFFVSENPMEDTYHCMVSFISTMNLLYNNSHIFQKYIYIIIHTLLFLLIIFLIFHYNNNNKKKTLVNFRFLLVMMEDENMSVLRRWGLYTCKQVLSFLWLFYCSAGTWFDDRTPLFFCSWSTALYGTH